MGTSFSLNNSGGAFSAPIAGGLIQATAVSRRDSSERIEFTLARESGECVVDRERIVLIVVRNVREVRRQAYVDLIVSEGFAVRQIPAGRDPIPMIRELHPVAACFQYDYPDIAGLSDLQRTKAAEPSTPLLMVTEEHSEALAVWAFRTRVWDYFVQPVEGGQLKAALSELSVFHALDRQGGGREVVGPPHTMPTESRVSAGSPVQDRTMDQALSYIERNLHKKITQSEVARICNLTSFQFSRVFKQRCGVTFQDYLVRRRITQAMHLLRHPGASIGDVCFAVGFRDMSYFTRTFHRIVGESPSHYRVMQRPASSPISTGASPAPNPPPPPPDVPVLQELRVEQPVPKEPPCPSWPHTCPMRANPQAWK